MKRFSMSVAAAALACVLIGGGREALAAGPPAYTGYVKYVGTYGTGDLFVGLDGSVSGGACAGARFDVPADHPQVKNWLAVAMTAYTSGTRVTVKATGCFNGVPSMDLSRESYFHLHLLQ